MLPPVDLPKVPWLSFLSTHFADVANCTYPIAISLVVCLAIPFLIPLRRFIKTMLSKEKVQFLAKFLSSQSGTDKAFRSYYYASKLMVYVLLRTKGPKSPLIPSLVNLANAFSDARYMLRFTHIVSVLEEALRPDTPPDDRFIHLTNRIKAWSMMAYYPLEYLYWLSSHKVLRLKNKETFESHTSIWSCRAWLLYVVVDIAATLYKLQQIRQKKETLLLKHSDLDDHPIIKEKGGKGAKKKAKHEEDPSLSEELAASRKQWQALQSDEEDMKLNLLGEVGDFPLALNWSLYTYPLPDVYSGIFGTISSYAWTAYKAKYT